ncbi:baculoviral IAP repeat-containing protein 7-A, partial [Trichonephila clavata]
MTDGVPDVRALRKMSDLKSRLLTFKGWPLIMLSAKQLAEHGFYYTGISDIVTCFYCNISLGNWKINDDPLIEHKKFSPHCAYMELIKMKSIKPPNTTDETIEDEVLRQACELFSKSTVQKVAVANFRSTGQHFKSLEDVCEAVFKFDAKPAKSVTLESGNRVEGNEEGDIYDEIETAIQNIPQDNFQVNAMPSGSGIQNSLSSNNLQFNPTPSGSGIQNNYLPPGLYNPYSSSHESFVLIRRLRRLERLERRRATRIARAESQAAESREEEASTSPPPPRDSRQNSPPRNSRQNSPPRNSRQNSPPRNSRQNSPPRNSRQNSPPRNSRRNTFQTRWGEMGPGFQNYGNFSQSEPLNRRLPQDMELFQYNILKKYMDHYVRHG